MGSLIQTQLPNHCLFVGWCALNRIVCWTCFSKPWLLYLLHCRFERGSLQHPGSLHDDSSSGNHTPVSTPSLSANSYGNGMGLGKNYPRKSKKLAEYEEGLVSLQSAPSGWGELPSPKITNSDNGTEFWGVPPDDLERQMREKARISSHSTSSTLPSGDMGKKRGTDCGTPSGTPFFLSRVGWLDGSPPEVDWVEDGWGANSGSGGGGGGDPVHNSWEGFNKVSSSTFGIACLC